MSNIDYDNLTDDELASLDLSEAQVRWTDDEPSDIDDTITTTDQSSTTQDEQNTDEAFDDESSQDGDTLTPESDTPAPEGIDVSEQSDDEADETSAPQGQNDNAQAIVDYQAFYEKLTKPFKANGRQIVVKNADDMITLMQQGANYSKKMAQLKPNLTALRVLEQHGLTDPKELAYLVELHQKKPEAIAKLVKDAQIDLYDFDTEQANDYTPQVQVNEVSELETVITELYENSTAFRDVLSNISGSWDDKSKAFIQEQPNVLYALAAQAEQGVYQQVVEAVEYERMMGRLKDKSFIEAYGLMESQVLDSLTADSVQQAAQQTMSFTAPRPSDEQPDQSNNQVMQDKKRKATTPKSGGNAAMDTFDPLALSDEEFLKFYEQQQFH